MKKCISFILAAAVLLCVCGCSLFERDFPVTVQGVKIGKMPESVACLSDSAASAIYALGYGDYLKGAPESFITEENKDIKSLGSTVLPDEEAVYALAPDILITPFELSASFSDGLKLRNVTVVTLAVPEKYSDVAGYYNNIAMLFAGEQKGTEAASTYTSELDRALEAMKTANASLTKSALVFVEEGFVVTGDTLFGEAIAKVGIKNVAAQQTDYMMSAVDIAAANPDVMFCPAGLSETILDNVGYKDITAVKNGSIYEIDVEEGAFAGIQFLSVLQEMSNYLK